MRTTRPRIIQEAQEHPWKALKAHLRIPSSHLHAATGGRAERLPLTLHARRGGGCVCGSVDAPSVVGRTGGCSAMSLRRLQYHCRGCMAARVAVLDARKPAVCPNVEIPRH
jgi:hypothetical protein